MAGSLVVYGYLNLSVTLGLVVAGPLVCATWLDVPSRVVGGLLAVSLAMASCCSAW